MKLFSYCSHKMIIFYRLVFTRVIAFGNFSNVNISLQLVLQFSVDTSETFQLLFPLPEEGHIIPRACLTVVCFNRLRLFVS